jgi:hypothetical protein
MVAHYDLNRSRPPDEETLRRAPSPAPVTNPTCEALLRNAERCRSVVIDAESSDELLRRYCGPHGDRIRQAAEQADAEEEVPPEEADEAPAPSNQEEADLVPELVPAGYPGTPRDTIREFALANPHLVDEFLRGVLAATQEVWVSCKHCKRRSEVAVPNWSARTKAVELLLEGSIPGTACLI